MYSINKWWRKFCLLLYIFTVSECENECINTNNEKSVFIDSYIYFEKTDRRTSSLYLNIITVN